MSNGIILSTDDRGCIDRATKMLAGIQGAASKAVNSAIRRAATSGEAYAAKVIRKEYIIKAGDFKTYTHSKRHCHTTGGSQSVTIEYFGNHIPLIKFDTSIDSSGRVTARVKRSSARQVLEHAFFSSRIGAREGIFERTTSSREPTKEIMGPSVPQMMSYNDNVKQAIADKVYDVFDERLDHEILAILNGWRN